MTDVRFCSSSCSSFCSRFLFFLFLTLFFVLFFTSGFVSSQKCVDFNSTSAASICQPYVSYDYFLPEGPTDWIIEALTSYNIHLATRQATLLPTKCEKKLLAFICAQGYQRCKTFEDGSVAARPVCSSLCEEVGEACAEAFAAGGQSAPDCSAQPKKTSEVLVNGEKRTVSCFTTNDNLDIPDFPFDCGFPLAYDKSVEDTMGFPCALQCPVPVVDKGFITAADWFVRFAAPSIVLLIIIMFGFQLYRLEWWMKFPRRYIFYESFFNLLAISAYLIPTFMGGYSEMGCVSETVQAQNNKVGCTWNNWFLIYGTWGSQQLFAIISLNVLVTVKRWTNPTFLRCLEVLYHFALFVPCAVILIVAEALHMTGTSGGSSACFYEGRDIDGLGDNGVLILTLLLPWALMQLFGYIFLFAALFFVWQTGGFTAIVKQTRLLLFLAIFGSSLSLGLILPFELAVWGNGPATRYLTCEIQNWAAGLFLNSQEQKLLPHCSKHHIFADPFAYYYNAAIHTVTFGLLVFIFFFPDAWREARRGKNSTGPTLNSSKISGLSKGSKQSSTTISSHSQNSQST